MVSLTDKTVLPIGVMVNLDESTQVHFADASPLNANKFAQVKLLEYPPLLVDESNATVTYDPSSLKVPDNSTGAGGSAVALITFKVLPS